MLYIWWALCVLGITAIAPTIISAFINPFMWVVVIILIVATGFAAVKADKEASAASL